MRKSLWSRRGFLGACAAGGFAMRATGGDWPKGMSHVGLDHFEHYTDEKTRARVYRLTSGPQRDDVVYQTHPMWSPDMGLLVFHSDRTSGTMTPHVLETSTGKVRPLLPDGKGGDFTLMHRGADVFWLSGRDVYTAPLRALFAGDAAPQRIASLPESVQRTQGMLSVDAKEAVLYTGAVFEVDKRWGIIGLNLKSGAWDTLAEVDFPVGHVQANPARADLVMFCHETGGYADQRTWLLDAARRTHRPLYVSPSRQWVTHELWWGGDRVLFTVWPYDDEHRELEHGILMADLDGAHTVVTQYPAWHTHGSPDKRWILGDDFDRNLWLIDAQTHERRLLTHGHEGGGLKTHPHASFTPDSQSIVFNSSRFGTADILLVELPAWESLPQP